MTTSTELTPFQFNLNRLMDAREWKPCQLSAAICADGLPLRESAVYRWMKGEREPQARYIKAIAKAFETTTDELFAEIPAQKAAS